MKYSLRSLIIAVLVGPPLLAWGAAPIYRWLMTPKPPGSVRLPNLWTKEMEEKYGKFTNVRRILPNASAPTPDSPKP
jgi:hypothetical protein